MSCRCAYASVRHSKFLGSAVTSCRFKPERREYLCTCPTRQHALLICERTLVRNLLAAFTLNSPNVKHLARKDRGAREKGPLRATSDSSFLKQRRRQHPRIESHCGRSKGRAYCTKYSKNLWAGTSTLRKQALENQAQMRLKETGFSWPPQPPDPLS